MNFGRKNEDMNCLGEFSDKNLENEFFNYEMQKSMRFLKPVILALGILNTLFLIPDYFLIENNNSLLMIAAGRVLFILLVIIFLIRLKHIKDYKVVAYWVTIYEIICILLFLFVFFYYESPDYLIQAFGVMIIVMAVFLVPNRWIYMVFTSVFLYVSFIVMSMCYIKNIKLSDFLAGAVYLGIVIVFSSITAFRSNYHKRIHYLNSKELTRLSTTDYLTGAYNRAKLNEEIEQHIRNSKKFNVPLSLAILDIDDFKKINDSYGHLTGDKVIKEIANIIRSGIRETDIFARWGGEEFVILFPNSDVENASDMAESIRKKIESHVFGEVKNVTASLGVAQLSPEDDMDNFLYKADQMLYVAKSSGKNSVKTFQENLTEDF